MGLLGFGGGLALGLLLAHVLGRVRRKRARDETQPSNAARRLGLQEPLYEKMESAWWLNRIAAQVWTKQAPYLSAALVEILQPLIDANCPPFLGSLKLLRLSLGSQAPQLNNLKTFRTRDDTSIIVDMDLDWVATNLDVGFGTKVLKLVVPLVRIDHLRMHAKLRVHVELRPQLLAVRALHMSLVQRPEIHLAIEPLSTGVNICSIPALSNWLYAFFSDTVAKPFLWPESFTLDLSSAAHNAAANASRSAPQPEREGGAASDSDRHELSVALGALGELASAIARGPVKRASAVHSYVAQMLKFESGNASMPRGTRGVLQVRVVEAARLRTINTMDANDVGNDAETAIAVDTVVGVSLREESRSTRIVHGSSAPFYDETFELYVRDEQHDVLLVQLFVLRTPLVHVHLPGPLDITSREPLGTAWICVNEVAAQSQWLDIWLELTQMSNIDSVAPSGNVRRGFVRLQLTYEQLLDVRDVEADRSRREQLQASNSARQRISPISELSAAPGVVGFWQVHLLEGARWTRVKDGRAVRDARCDLRCGLHVVRSRTSSHEHKEGSAIWGQFFELPVVNAKLDVLHVIGIDEDPFTRSSQVGDGVLALLGCGDVQPQELWIALRRRSSQGAIETAGWVRAWVSFSSLLQDVDAKDWLVSSARIAVNPSSTYLRQRAEGACAEALPQEGDSSASLSTNHSSATNGQSSLLLGGLAELNADYVVGLAKRVPRSLFGFGTTLVYHDVITNMVDAARGGRTKTCAEAPEPEGVVEDGATDGTDTSASVMQRHGRAQHERHIQTQHTFIVELYTGNRKNATADRDVYIEFLARGAGDVPAIDPQDRVIGRITMPRGRDRFRTGKKDVVVVHCDASLDNLGALRIAHSGSVSSVSRNVARRTRSE